MSYSIQLSGHSSEPHNEEVKAIAADALAKLEALPGASGTYLSGFSNDNTGSITLGSAAVAQVEEAENA